MRKVFLAGSAVCVVLGACADAPAQDQIEAGEQVYEGHSKLSWCETPTHLSYPI